MPERREISAAGFSIPTPTEKAFHSADQIAHLHDLEPLPTEALRKYAALLTRIGIIREDFVGTTTQRRVYSFIQEVHDVKVTVNFVINRDNYQGYLNILRSTAFNLYRTYFAPSRETREAAGDIQRAVADNFIEYPLADFHDEAK